MLLHIMIIVLPQLGISIALFTCQRHFQVAGTLFAPLTGRMCFAVPSTRLLKQSDENNVTETNSHVNFCFLTMTKKMGRLQNLSKLHSSLQGKADSGSTE